MGDGAFDHSIAAHYDEGVAERFRPDWLGPEVDFLGEAAAGRPVLEFASGTGRVTIPLAARGPAVHGIELSAAMVGEMRAKPGAEAVSVTVGDMATTRVPGRFGLVFVVFNTITNLLTQDEQVGCFRNAADHLEPGGCFVVETMVPALQRLPVGERYLPFRVDDDHIGIDDYDVVRQLLTSHHVTSAGRTSTAHRYAWPAEYDLMARLAGLQLRERWADWHRNPFTATSTAHVSVWEKPR